MAILTGLIIPAKAMNNSNLSRFPEYILKSGLTSVQRCELLTFKLETAREATAGCTAGPSVGEDFLSVQLSERCWALSNTQPAWLLSSNINLCVYY